MVTRLFAVLLLFVSFIANAQTAREIVSHYLDTVSNGDVKAWSKIKSAYTESEVYYSQQDFDQKINLLKADKPSFHKLYWVAPFEHKDVLFEDSTFTRMTSTFYFLNDRTIILMYNIPPIIKDKQIRDEFVYYFLPEQIRKLLEKSKSVELLGIKDFPNDGILCYEIRITAKGRHYLLYIDTTSFLLRYWNGREDQDTGVMTKFDNYKRIDGLLMPMLESMTKGGIPYYYCRTRKIELNATIDPKELVYEEKK
jgi:hypothetical protein